MTELLLILSVKASATSGTASPRVTRRGHRRLRRLARALRRLGVELDRLYHGPPLPSIETADAIASCIEGESVVTNGLCVPPSEELLAKIVGEHVAVVCEEPYWRPLAAWLLNVDADRHESFALKPAGVAWLSGELTPGGMRLKSLLSARVLRTIARQ
jgi:phosphohistidine phosphatase